MSKCDQFAPFCIRLQLSWLTMALRTTSQCNIMGITFGKWAGCWYVSTPRIISYTSRQSLPVEDFVVWKITNTCVGSIGSGTRQVLRCLRLVRITAVVITRKSPWSCRRSGLLSVCIKAYLNVGKLQQTRSCKCHACHQWIGLLISALTVRSMKKCIALFARSKRSKHRVLNDGRWHPQQAPCWWHKTSQLLKQFQPIITNWQHYFKIR